MSQAQHPLLPTSGDTPDQQRMLAGLNNFVRSVLNLGIFLTRPKVSNIVLPRPHADTPLRWSVLNRIVLAQDAVVLLPRITPDTIGVPLDVVLLNALYTLTLAPSGLGGDRQTKPLINGAATISYTQIGLYILKNDGQNWFVAKGG